MTTAAAHTEAKILAIVHEQGRILLEQLPSYLPGSTWNQVFLGVDALSRQGAIRLRRRGCDYEIVEANSRFRDQRIWCDCPISPFSSPAASACPLGRLKPCFYTTAHIVRSHSLPPLNLRCFSLAVDRPYVFMFRSTDPSSGIWLTDLASAAQWNTSLNGDCCTMPPPPERFPSRSSLPCIQSASLMREPLCLGMYFCRNILCFGSLSRDTRHWTHQA